MTRHETERLWALAADELELDDRRYVELHLSDCPECRDSLEAVELARRALDSARSSSPGLDWLSTDERIGALVEKRMRANARPRWMPFALTGALVATAAAVTFLLWPAPVKEVPPSEPPLVQVAEPKPIRVELARGLTRVAATSEPIAAGETLKSGDVLRTGVAGKAFVHLPDSSHLRVAAATQVSLTRAEAEDVALTVSRGRVSVRASHEQRRAFVVHAGDVSVHVVGTIFSVENGPEGVEVAVSEGEVRVASGESKETNVGAGQRLNIDPRGKAKLGKLTPLLERELSEVQGVAEAVTSAEQQVTVAAKGGAVQNRPQGGNLPRLSSEEAKARQVVVEPAAPVQPAPEASTSVTLEPETLVEVERADGPGTAFPSLAGGYTRGVPFKNEVAIEAPAPAPAPASAPAPAPAPAKPDGPASEESDWVALPKSQPPAMRAPPTLIVPMLEPLPAPAPAPAPTVAAPPPAAPAPVPAPTPVASAKSSSKSLEQVFLEKAEASLAQGGCERFLPGLEDIALESQGSGQLARVLRARCFDAQLRPKQAMSEYAKYLEAYPNGRFAEEARSALGQ